MVEVVVRDQDELDVLHRQREAAELLFERRERLVVVRPGVDQRERLAGEQPEVDRPEIGDRQHDRRRLGHEWTSVAVCGIDTRIE